MNLKEEYKKLLINKLSISKFDKIDLTDNENILISESLKLFLEKIEDIKILQFENNRLKIELANLKASLDDNDY